MKWYKKQLAEKLKQIETSKSGEKKESGAKKSRHSFDPRKISGGKKIFSNQVAAMNRNRKKTDLP